MVHSVLLESLFNVTSYQIHAVYFLLFILLVDVDFFQCNTFKIPVLISLRQYVNALNTTSILSNTSMMLINFHPEIMCVKGAFGCWFGTEKEMLCFSLRTVTAAFGSAQDSISQVPSWRFPQTFVIWARGMAAWDYMSGSSGGIWHFSITMLRLSVVKNHIWEKNHGSVSKLLPTHSSFCHALLSQFCFVASPNVVTLASWPRARYLLIVAFLRGTGTIMSPLESTFGAACLCT